MRAPTSPDSANRQPRAPYVTFARRIAAPVVALLAFTLLLVVSPGVEATPPELAVRAAVVPGGHLAVTGQGFTSGAHVELRWDDAAIDAYAIAGPDGGFSATIVVPVDAKVGEHTLSAIELQQNGEGGRRTDTTILVVEPADTAAAPGPTASPSPTALQTSDDLITPLRRPTTQDEHDAHGDEPSATPTAQEHATPSPTADHGDHGGTAVATAEPSSDDHTGHAPPESSTQDCSTYPEPRVLLEIHTWWEGDPVPEGHIAHLHAETCFPVGQTVSGVLTLDTRIVLHDNPGHLWRYDSHLHDGIGQTVRLDETCGLDQTCEYWVRTEIDTRELPDGCYEYRNKPRVELPNGDVMLTSGGWPLRTENGNSDLSGGFRDQDTCWDDGRGITGRGWYDNGHDYQNPVLVGPVSDVVAGATVSGTWTPTLRLDAGSGGHEPTFSAAYIDADFHHNEEDTDGGGMILGQWDGEFRGKLPIDTTRLSNGSHKLILRVEAETAEGRLVALQYVPIVVSN